MRDKNRIRPFLDKLEELWVENPDWRFAQLVTAIQEKAGKDIFFYEEEELLETLEGMLEETKSYRKSLRGSLAKYASPERIDKEKDAWSEAAEDKHRKSGDSIILPIEEINKLYDGDLVLLINCTVDDKGRLIQGEVVVHDKDRNRFYEEAMKYKNEESMMGVRYAGRLPEGIILVL
jgi:hypothetical protein